jgi:hypothetical protein
VTRAVAIASAIEDRIDKGLPAIPEIDHARRQREEAARAKRQRAADEVECVLLQANLNRKREVGMRIDLHRLLDAEMADLDRFLSRPLPELAARLRRDIGLEVTEEDAIWLHGEDPAAEPPRAGGAAGADRRPAPPAAAAAVIPSAFEFVRAAAQADHQQPVDPDRSAKPNVAHRIARAASP